MTTRCVTALALLSVLVIVKIELRDCSTNKDKSNLISSRKALQYLKHPASKQRRSLTSLDNECCYETCVQEERREHRLIGSYVNDKLRYNCKYFYCENEQDKFIDSAWKCDGDNDCGNSEDEKYCKLTQKYKKQKYTDAEIISRTELKGGVSKFEGNVYVLDRPVCDDSWSQDEARVICRSLGCSTNTIAVPFSRAYFGRPAFADFILDNVDCRGYEKHIGSCKYITVDNCRSHEVAGVRCIDPNTIELRGGKTGYFGNVYISGMPVCDNKWNTPSAEVVCQSLGRSSRVIAKSVTNSLWGKTGQSYALDEVKCNGYEKHITNCPHSKHTTCGEGHGAGVVCFEPDSIKLTQGSEGFVMAMDRPIIDNKWWLNESQVVCNQLFGDSFASNAVPVFNSTLVYIQQQVNIKCLVRDVKCTGSENGIEECSINVTNDCPSTKRFVPRISCAVCTEKDLVNALQSLDFDGTRQAQYKAVVKQLNHLKTNCRNWNCGGKERYFTYPSFCAVKLFLDDWKSILETVPTDDQVVFLENKFHYSKLLEQSLLKQRFSSLKNDIANLGDQTSAFQQSLADHFKTLSQFDAMKIQTDLKSLTASWSTSTNGIRDEKSLLQKQLSDLSTLASKVLIADKIELAVNVVLQVVQTVLGGLKSLAGNLASIHNSAADIAKSALKSAQLGFIIQQLPEMQKTITEIEKNMEQNKKSHSVINRFFEEAQNSRSGFSLETARQFLNHYKDYRGAIDAVKVAQLHKSLDFMVDGICGMISSASSVSGNVMVTIKAGEGPCLKPKLTIASIITTFKELRGDQGKIIQGYAALAKAKLSKHSAEDLAIILKTNLNDPVVRALTMARSALQLRDQKRRLIKEACDEITYLNHGVEENFCTQLKSNIDSDVGKLISYKRKDMCLGNSHEKMVVLPAQFTNITSLDTLNMGQLLQNSNDSYWKTEGSTFFKIPNEKWLLDHGWIQKGEKGPFFVKKFEIFLPPIQPKQSTEYIVQTQAEVLTSVVNKINYAFPDQINMKCKYYDNARSPSLACLEKLTPYAQCPGTHLRPVCIIGKTKDTGPFYPPVTSLWKLDIKSKYQLPEIHTKTPFFVQARVQLCASGASSFTRRKRSTSHCCQKGNNNKYYDPMERIAAAGKNPCKDCPPNTSTRLEGYFCEECPVGQQPNTELYGCEACPPGTHKNSTGPAYCQ